MELRKKFATKNEPTDEFKTILQNGLIQLNLENEKVEILSSIQNVSINSLMQSISKLSAKQKLFPDEAKYYSSRYFIGLIHAIDMELHRKEEIASISEQLSYLQASKIEEIKKKISDCSLAKKSILWVLIVALFKSNKNSIISSYILKKMKNILIAHKDIVKIKNIIFHFLEKINTYYDYKPSLRNKIRQELICLLTSITSDFCTPQ